MYFAGGKLEVSEGEQEEMSPEKGEGESHHGLSLRSNAFSYGF